MVFGCSVQELGLGADRDGILEEMGSYRRWDPRGDGGPWEKPRETGSPAPHPLPAPPSIVSQPMFFPMT